MIKSRKPKEIKETIPPNIKYNLKFFCTLYNVTSFTIPIGTKYWILKAIELIKNNPEKKMKFLLCLEKKVSAKKKRQVDDKPGSGLCEKNINSYQKEPRNKLNLAVLSENSNLANEYIPIGINNETKQKNIFIMFTYITG